MSMKICRIISKAHQKQIKRNEEEGGKECRRVLIFINVLEI